MQIRHSSFAFERKDIGSDNERGVFTGYVSVYGNKDSYGDIVQPGAFTDTLAQKGNVFPLLWQHKTDVPIGEMHVVDTPNGLFVQKGIINLGVTAGRDAYALLKDTPGALSKMSIGYSVPAGGEQIAEDGSNHLTKINLWEGSLVTFPANDLATITSVKETALSTDQLDAIAQAVAVKLAAAADDAGTVFTPAEIAYWKEINQSIHRRGAN